MSPRRWIDLWTAKLKGYQLRSPFILALSIVASVAILICVFHAPILRAIGGFLVHDDRLIPADAIVVLTGDLFHRPEIAARLYRQGLASQILIAEHEQNLAEKLKIVPLHDDLLRSILHKFDVPDSVILILPFKGGVTSTHDEALSLREFSASQPSLRSVIIVTSAFHTRRAGMTFRKVLKDRQIEIMLTAAPDEGFDVSDWWKHEDGLIVCVNEYIKIVYYWLKY